MSKYYYLSQFIGSGTQIDPFRPLTTRFAPSSMLDLRPNETQPEGWCFACIEHDNQSNIETSDGLLYLGEDVHVNLSMLIINQMKECLQVDFKSQNLADIVAEILLFERMPGRGLRPGLDGSYRLCLDGLLWEATETEAYEFVGRLREDELLGPPPSTPSKQMTNLRPALDNALTTIAVIVDSGLSGWLKNETDRVEKRQSNHPLATNYYAAKKLLDDFGFACRHESSAAIWILMLARDLRITSQQSDVKRISSRLRDPGDCEPTKFELYIMASYIEAGARVEITDTDSRGEFRVFEDSQWVYIECKYKNIERMRQRQVKIVFDTANDHFRSLMKKKNVKALVQISCRTDPIKEDLPKLKKCISHALESNVCEAGLQLKCGGKFKVSILPNTWVTADAGVKFPVGFEYGFSEATVNVDSSDEPTTYSGWGVAWRVLRPGGWIRSVVNSVRQAAGQVPKESANLIYIHIPTGSLGTMTTRIDSVTPEIEYLLSHPDRYKRVNAVILTGQATLRGWSAPNVATVRFMYQSIANKNPRYALPSNFRVFGLDYTRN